MVTIVHGSPHSVESLVDTTAGYTLVSDRRHVQPYTVVDVDSLIRARRQSLRVDVYVQNTVHLLLRKDENVEKLEEDGQVCESWFGFAREEG